MLWSGQLVKVVLPEVLLQDVAAASALVVYHVNIPGIKIPLAIVIVA